LKLRLGSDCNYADLMNLATKMRSLEKLYLYLHDNFDSTNVNGNDFLSCLVDHATGLKYLRLEIYGMEHSTTALEKLAQLNLRELSIVGQDIHNSTLVAWGNGFGEQLTSLKIFGVAFDNGFMALIYKSPHLRYLDINSAGITDHSLQAVATTCLDLRRMTMTYCPEITLNGVQGIIDACSQLKTVAVLGNRGYVSCPAGLKIGKYRKINFEKEYKY